MNNSINTLKKEIDTLSSQLLEIDNVIENSSITAEQDGTIVYNQEIAVGDSIMTGMTVATIVPKTMNYIVDIFIPESNIAEIEVGQKVEYQFSAISAIDFGEVSGEIKAIDVYPFTEQSTGQKFYKAIASIERTVLSNSDGETRELKVGMIAQVHAITGNQRILFWLLGKLNFI